LEQLSASQLIELDEDALPSSFLLKIERRILMVTDFQESAGCAMRVEPVAAGVYFAPEPHAAYAALGFAGSPISQDGVARRT
jgi:hypothetical protein